MPKEIHGKRNSYPARTSVLGKQHPLLPQKATVKIKQMTVLPFGKGR
jgi:hypothetical protein